MTRSNAVILAAAALTLTSCSVDAEAKPTSFTPAPVETVYVTPTPEPAGTAEAVGIEDQVAYTKAVMFSTTLTYDDITADDLLEWGEGVCGEDADDYRLMLTLTQDFEPEQAYAIVENAEAYLCK